MGDLRMGERTRAEVLDQALSPEQTVLAMMRRLTQDLPDDSAYREVIARHQQALEDAIGQLEEITNRGDDEQAG